MTDETLEWILNEVPSLPKSCLNRVSGSYLHHSLQESPLRQQRSIGIGDVFVSIVNGRSAGGGYFWFNLESGEFDLHIYTFPKHQRQGVATALFVNAIVPWLQEQGYAGERVVTTARSESIGLLNKLGFVAVDNRYEYEIPITLPGTD